MEEHEKPDLAFSTVLPCQIDRRAFLLIVQVSDFALRDVSNLKILESSMKVG